ncbi:MAG: hypothetical protein KAI79_18920 [Bacteroidales bacterium]|nr:hypothetical protein [Bacteroidales bacterium]
MFVHLHRKKRFLKRIKGILKFPLPNPRIKLLDKVVGFVSIIFPLTAIPQVLKIWTEKSSEGVSLISWILWSILYFVLFVYAIVHKDMRLRTLFGLWFVISLFVILEIILYN